MPRLKPIEDSEATGTQRLLIENARVNGAPDPLCARIYVRSEAGRNWLRMWNELFNGGILPVPLKEAVRVLISTKHFCGYCSTVRSNVAIPRGSRKIKFWPPCILKAASISMRKKKPRCDLPRCSKLETTLSIPMPFMKSLKNISGRRNYRVGSVLRTNGRSR